MRLIIWLIIIGVLVCAWCPWFGQAAAVSDVAANVQTAQKLVTACVLTPEPATVSKSLFGYTEMISYNCNPAGTGSVSTGEDTAFVTFFNYVFGIPNPAVE